jgi:hypothetical protein
VRTLLLLGVVQTASCNCLIYAKDCKYVQLTAATTVYPVCKQSWLPQEEQSLISLVRAHFKVGEDMPIRDLPRSDIPWSHIRSVTVVKLAAVVFVSYCFCASTLLWQ